MFHNVCNWINRVYVIINCISTGSYLYPDLAQKIESIFGSISVTYGITELCGSFTYKKHYDYVNTFNVGKVADSINIKTGKDYEIFINSSSIKEEK